MNPNANQWNPNSNNHQGSNIDTYNNYVNEVAESHDGYTHLSREAATHESSYGYDYQHTQNNDESNYYYDSAGVGAGINVASENNVNVPIESYNDDRTMMQHHETAAAVAVAEMEDLAAAMVVPPPVPGSFYPFTEYVPHVQSAPISAVAIDPAVDAVYVAGHTITFNKKRRHAAYSNPSSAARNGSGSGSRRSGTSLFSSDHRVSMFATHGFSDGMLYSSVAGHDEARKDVLDGLMNALYGHPETTPSSSVLLDENEKKKNIHSSTNVNITKILKIPRHAYRPPYTRPRDDTLQNAAIMMFKKKSCMGINKILPFSSPVASGNSEHPEVFHEGYVCTVSPSAVRVHKRGGLLLGENNLEGLMTGTFHPGVYNNDGYDDVLISSNVSHVTVGGYGMMNGPNLFCMDLYTNTLKTVASHTVRSANGHECCITDLVTSHETGNIVAGCSDGTLRIFDGRWRNYKECAQVRGHSGGIAQVAASGNLICTTGYSSRSSGRFCGGNDDAFYAFPDEHVLVFDIRYLGRGGILHPFSGLNGGPRFISFLPQGQDDKGDSRILVGSGQADGGLQIITPFEELTNSVSEMTNYINPPLNPGEAITALHVVGKDMAMGTSFGNVLHYKMANNDNSITSKPYSTLQDSIPELTGGSEAYSMGIQSNYTKSKIETGNVNELHEDQQSDVKEKLIVPSYEPDPPPLSIEPQVLMENNIFNQDTSYSIFSSYVISGDPISSNSYSFGTLTNSVIKHPNKRILSKKLLDLMTTQNGVGDCFIPTSELGLDLVGHEGKSNETFLSNTNKLLNVEKLGRLCYNIEADPRKKDQRSHKRGNNVDTKLPPRYICKNRPLNSRFSAFDFAALNDTIYPGWDYALTMPNSYACSVLLLLYFVPEIRGAMLSSQLRNINDSVMPTKKQSNVTDTSLCAELGFLFHQIDSLSSHAMVYPKPPGGKQDPCRCVVGAFVPSNFLSTFAKMPEASNLALLDENPAATEVERRPEAFYRFLLHHLNKELNGLVSDNSISQRPGGKRQSGGRNLKSKEKGDTLNFIDSLHGMNAVSMTDFINEQAGPPYTNITRLNTVDLAYDAFINNSEESSTLPEFGAILRYSLCKDVRYTLSKDVPFRGWCATTNSFEPAVQWKIISSLPKIMSLSCACAGINGEDRLPLWRKSDDCYQHWLPEYIEVEIEDSGNIITRQLRGKTWEEFHGEGLPDSISDVLRKETLNERDEGKNIARYRLEATLTFINCEEDAADKRGGHHCLHIRVPASHKRQTLLNQLEITKKHLESVSSKSQRELCTLLRDLSSDDLNKRIETIEQRLHQLDNEQGSDEWVLFNGPNVSSTVVEDALAFHVSFKEPCIITYRQVDEPEENDCFPLSSKIDIPCSIMNSPLHSESDDFSDLVAFDAEFVQVQFEDSILTASGSKMVLREGRNALGRMSLIDCRTGRTIVDDHVLPRESVVDYLTRFSGIKPSDLNPQISPHHLISSKTAYLKMRYLVDRGCIFVGHGLSQDFLTVNIFVPPSQIIDTSDIFSLERRRLISLRFLVNYLLGKDMQQEVHDSVEDSLAACQLYLKALELKRNGTFENVLLEIYDCGQRIDWKVGELKSDGRSVS